jgi:cytoskeleton protein RodZ
MSGENRDARVDPGIGRSLGEARKSKGLTLRQVEQETRIRSRYLRDLEQENFDVLPAVYVLGSLKTYADFLGLDGAALSRQLKASLVEPAEPDVPEQLAALGGTRDEDDEYEAAPVPAVGFDQLFLGMGVILISILAVMTIVAAVAQGDESPISQINQPSTPDSPSEIALAGNVQDGDGVKRAGDKDAAEDENREDKPEAPKADGDGEEDEGEGDDQDTPQSASLFGDVDFVPMPPSSSPTAAASASVSPTPASPTAVRPEPATAASPEPATVEPDGSQASAAPASTGAAPEPAGGDCPPPPPPA